MPGGKEYVNSIGMKLVRIEPGEFMMGNENRVPVALTEPLSYPRRSILEKQYRLGAACEG